MREQLVILALWVLAVVNGSAPLPARPLVKHGGFIVSDANAGGNKAGQSPAASNTPDRSSFVSLGIRSGCAREKAATAGTLRNKNESGASAASRLRGGSSWIPHPPVRVSHADMEHQQAKARAAAGGNTNADPVSAHRPTDSCNRGAAGSGGAGSDEAFHAAEFTVANQRMVDDAATMATGTDSFEDEDQDGVSGGGGGGGGDGRFAPSFPRALPAAANGKVPFNKKFAWVP